MKSTPRSPLVRLAETLNRIIRGKPETVRLLLVGVLARGHILIEDVPGVGKTTLAKTLARLFAVEFARVQFTPDLLPSDIVGSQVLNPHDGSFSFRPGPLFTNVLLADEINRASPRTQSALLEAMNEGQVTVEGTTYPLPDPFVVLATQNPVDFQGTYPLPEAQLDRFLVRFGLGYPSPEDELQVLFDRKLVDPLLKVEPVAHTEELLTMQRAVCDVEVEEDVGRYLLQIVDGTRQHPGLERGVSTRGALSYFRAAQAHAFLDGRSYVSPDDIQLLAVPVLCHRTQLTSEARYGEGGDAAAILGEILDRVKVPV